MTFLKNIMDYKFKNLKFRGSKVCFLPYDRFAQKPKLFCDNYCVDLAAWNFIEKDFGFTNTFNTLFQLLIW